MLSHGLRQLVADKPVASCQQTCCKLIVKICYPQACCKLVSTSCNKSANDMKVVTILILTDLLQLDEIDKFVATCRQVTISR